MPGPPKTKTGRSGGPSSPVSSPQRRVSASPWRSSPSAATSSSVRSYSVKSGGT